MDLVVLLKSFRYFYKDYNECYTRRIILSACVQMGINPKLSCKLINNKFNCRLSRFTWWVDKNKKTFAISAFYEDITKSVTAGE